MFPIITGVSICKKKILEQFRGPFPQSPRKIIWIYQRQLLDFNARFAGVPHSHRCGWNNCTKSFPKGLNDGLAVPFNITFVTPSSTSLANLAHQIWFWDLSPQRSAPTNCGWSSFLCLSFGKKAAGGSGEWAYRNPTDYPKKQKERTQIGLCNRCSWIFPTCVVFQQEFPQWSGLVGMILEVLCSFQHVWGNERSHPRPGGSRISVGILQGPKQAGHTVIRRNGVWSVFFLNIASMYRVWGFSSGFWKTNYIAELRVIEYETLLHSLPLDLTHHAKALRIVLQKPKGHIIECIYIYTYAYTPIVSYSTETSTICWWYGNYLWLFFEHELDYMRCHVCHFNENAWITYMCTLRCFSSIVDLATSNPIILDLLSHETWDLNSWYCTLQGSHPKLWEISPFSGPKEQV